MIWLKLKTFFCKILQLNRKEKDPHEEHWGIGAK